MALGRLAQRYLKRTPTARKRANPPGESAKDGAVSREAWTTVEALDRAAAGVLPVTPGALPEDGGRGCGRAKR